MTVVSCRGFRKSPLVLHPERIIGGDRSSQHPPAFTLYRLSWQTAPTG